jgi:predicted 3-demethylubiquinone-9 3-methyltransferase (glyoxalase superfamily)
MPIAVKTCLWFDGTAEEAARFYTMVIPGSEIVAVSHYSALGPGAARAVLAVDFRLCDHDYVALNGGPQFPFTDAASIQVYCEEQPEVDRIWDALIVGGHAGACGWLKDRYGLSWQVIPAALPSLLADPDPRRARRATAAMLSMSRLDLWAIAAAADQAG